MELSSDQVNAISTLMDWYNSPTRKQFITLGGYAGTGKTTVVSELRSKFPVNLKIAYCAYTGKATSILRNKLQKSKSIYSGDSISTIHSLIYEPIIIELLQLRNTNFLKQSLTPCLIVSNGLAINCSFSNRIKFIE